MQQLAVEMTCKLPSNYFRMENEETDRAYEALGEHLAELFGEHLPASMSREDAINTFKCRRSRASALLELIGIAYCDTSYDPDEQELIQEIGLAFGFAKEDVLAMENWVLRQISLVREAEDFFDAEVTV